MGLGAGLVAGWMLRQMQRAEDELEAQGVELITGY